MMKCNRQPTQHNRLNAISVLFTLACTFSFGGCDRKPDNSKTIDSSSHVLKEYYPIGRKFSTLLDTIVTGKAKNSDWGIQSEAPYSFTTHMEFETTVKANAGGRLVLERKFKDGRQSLVVGNKSYHFNLPSTPLYDQVTRALKSALPPGIRLVITAMKELDPNGEHLLDALLSVAEHLDIYPLPDLVAFKMREFNELNGKTITLTYFEGELIDFWPKFKIPDLNNWLRRAHGILMDHYIFPVRDKKVGATWTVEADKLGGMLLEPENPLVADGLLHVKRIKTKDSDKAKWFSNRLSKDVVTLSITDGRIDFLKENDKHTHSGYAIVVPNGKLMFDPNKYIVFNAVLTFKGYYKIESKDHLLFKAEQINEPLFRVYYNTTIIK